MTQMEQWSILSNVLNYIQHDKHPMINHNLSMRAVNKCKSPRGERRECNYGFGFWCHTKNTM